MPKTTGSEIKISYNCGKHAVLAYDRVVAIGYVWQVITHFSRNQKLVEKAG